MPYWGHSSASAGTVRPASLNRQRIQIQPVRAIVILVRQFSSSFVMATQRTKLLDSAQLIAVNPERVPDQAPRRPENPPGWLNRSGSCGKQCGFQTPAAWNWTASEPAVLKVSDQTIRWMPTSGPRLSSSVKRLAIVSSLGSRNLRAQNRLRPFADCDTVQCCEQSAAFHAGWRGPHPLRGPPFLHAAVRPVHHRPRPRQSPGR